MLKVIPTQWNPNFKLTCSAGRSVAHNIATFLTGEEKWRWNPATIVSGACTMLLLIVTEILIKTKLRLTTTATTTNNMAIRKDTNPLQNVTLIQCIEIAFFILLQVRRFGRFKARGPFSENQKTAVLPPLVRV